MQHGPYRIAIPLAILLMAALLPARAQATSTPRPAGPAVFRSSMTAITASLGFVHATGTDATRQGGKTAKAHITSDCAMTPTSITGWFRLQGTRFGGPGAGNSEYTAEWSWAGGHEQSRTWVRSSRTFEQWKRAHSDNTALEFVLLCPILSVRATRHGGTTAPMSPGTFRNLGPATMHGYATWHLHSETHQGKGFTRLDLFVDRQTGYWVRFDQRVRARTYTGRSEIDYSLFNVPVTIQMP